jgi:zinc D-Ala-D-Ala carboxypeptidase
VDGANAKQDVADTAEGCPAARSRYGSAPGGDVELSIEMLAGVLAVSGRFAIAVSEIAGGSHSPRSRHYAGLAFDINRIDGRAVSAAHPSLEALRTLLGDLGATEVRGPGDPGHDTHVHAGWPRA